MAHVQQQSSAKKIKLLTSVVSLLIILCSTIAIVFAPKWRHHSNYEKHKFTSEHDNVKVDDDVSHFLVATPEIKAVSRSQFGANSCPAGKGLWNMVLITDWYGFETDWALYSNNNERIANGPPSPYNYEDSTKYQGNLCLPVGRYYMKWMDMVGDGICCTYGKGSWVVKVNGQVKLQSTEDDNYKEKDYYFRVSNSGGSPPPNGDVAVDTPLGLVIGTRTDERFRSEFVQEVDAFLGIKYGRIPARFRKSQLFEQNRQYIDATDFAPFCWQAVDMPYYKDQPQSEDVS